MIVKLLNGLIVFWAIKPFFHKISRIRRDDSRIVSDTNLVRAMPNEKKMKQVRFCKDTDAVSS